MYTVACRRVPSSAPLQLIQLWGTASTSNIDILERFQSIALRMIVDAPWYVPNTVIRRDIQTPTVKKSAATALNTVLASAHTQTA
jgi:hypothetical protein